MEAAGIELFNPLILRKLLVSLEATSAKNATLPGGRYKNGQICVEKSLARPWHYLLIQRE